MKHESIHIVVPPYPQSRFPWFQLPAVNHGAAILNGKFQKETIRKF